uniref:Arp2/3 complex 34 kDa subunit n=1 Tax=Meloidogyne javanica TaxID=6303 RepID=A0A915N5V0_MELJA
MSKRKIEDDKSTQNIWEKFKLDSKGFLFDIQIKQQLKEDEKSKQKLFEVYQGSREEKLTLLPTPCGEPTPGINGFRSITLQGMRDWESGIENIIEFISKIITLSPQKGSEEETEQKLCLEIHLPFAFKGNQETNFSKNLGALLSIPTLSKFIGAFSYSTGGCLPEFLTRFPLLEPNPELFYRYDINVYCENDTLVEARLKFVVDREDTAQQIISLLKEKFETATNQCTFTLRLDCPGFALQPFSVENTNSGEETEGDGDSNSSSTSVVVWKSYKLVRASNANLLGQLMKGHLPLLKRKLILN